MERRAQSLLQLEECEVLEDRVDYEVHLTGTGLLRASRKGPVLVERADHLGQQPGTDPGVVVQVECLGLFGRGYVSSATTGPSSSAFSIRNAVAPHRPASRRK